jgi:hypothetical protein
MKIETYIIALALLSTIVASLSVGSSMVYSSTDDDENHPCYKAGFEAGRSGGSYNQTQQSDCGNTGYSHAYYEGFISGCISSGGGDFFACDSKTDKSPTNMTTP